MGVKAIEMLEKAKAAAHAGRCGGAHISEGPMKGPGGGFAGRGSGAAGRARSYFAIEYASGCGVGAGSCCCCGCWRGSCLSLAD
eukprot:3026428-Prymnesium_polylepis.1